LTTTTHVHAAFPERLIQGTSVPSLAPIVKQAAPAVVNVSTYTIRAHRNPLLSSPFFRHFFQLPEDPAVTKRTQSAGSGVIVDAENGFVLTNHHVIQNADEVEITLQDGRRFKATILGSDKKVDLAVLQIPAENLTSIPLASDNAVQVGDFVLAIGSPFGLQQTVTSGIVSALGRNGLGVQGYEDFIQTDASINPGNSGGALIDLRGTLIGINSAILAPSGGNVGIGFAIPSEVAQSVMNQLILYGEVKRGGIGARFQDLTPELANAFELNRYQGALVNSVKVESSSERAGLKAGDLIIEANDRPVNSAADMANRIGLSPLGSVVALKVIRDGKPIQLEVTIEEIPIPEIAGDKLHPSLSGVRLQDLIHPDYESAVGCIIVDIDQGSPAAQQGLEIGDIIFGANQKRVHNIDELVYLTSREPLRSFNL
ncbi:serine endoprotease DegQ, partial [Oleiphilus sp. HI0073]